MTTEKWIKVQKVCDNCGKIPYDKDEPTCIRCGDKLVLAISLEDFENALQKMKIVTNGVMANQTWCHEHEVRVIRKAIK